MSSCLLFDHFHKQILHSSRCYRLKLRQAELVGRSFWNGKLPGDWRWVERLEVRLEFGERNRGRKSLLLSTCNVVNWACANYVTVPGFHWFEDAQTGWVARQKLTDASCRERYCWESRKRVEFRLWTELGRVFFVFKMVKSYVLCMGVANVHVKKNQGLAFRRTGDRPEALLCPKRFINSLFSGLFLIKFSSLSAPTKIEELKAGQCSHSCAVSGKNSKCEESNECFQRAMNRCGEPSFLSFTIRAWGIQRLLCHHLLPGWSLGQLQPLIFYLWDLLWVRKEGESKVERNWFSVSANGKKVPASSLATQSLWRGFCMRVRGSSSRVELRHDVFAQAPLLPKNFDWLIDD